MKTLSFLSLPLFFLPSVAAQDMLAVDWSGAVYAVDSYAVRATLVGKGLFGQDAAAIGPRGRVWSTHQKVHSGNLQFYLTTVDPKTGAGTVVHKALPDIRAMAGDGSNTLWTIVNGYYDELHKVDVVTGTFTKVGSTGRKGIQGLALYQGRLLAWDVSAGLVEIQRSTGRAVDVNSKVGGGGGSKIQFLASRADGKLIGGKNNLYEVDAKTGVIKLLGNLGTSLDLRGAVEWFATARSFGKGCAGTYGLVKQTVSGTLRPGGKLVTASNNHASGATGALVVGFSRSSYNGTPLPINLDRVFGTSGCWLLVSIDVIVWGRATNTAPGVLSFGFPVPPIAAGLDLHLQHAAFERIPGGISWSDGATVNIGY